MEDRLNEKFIYLYCIIYAMNLSGKKFHVVDLISKLHPAEHQERNCGQII